MVILFIKGFIFIKLYKTVYIGIIIYYKHMTMKLK